MRLCGRPIEIRPQLVVWGCAARFARAQKLPTGKERETMERDLGYTLHKPRRRHFPTLPVIVFGIDEQWVADLIEVINITKSSRG